jgi:hypothetical protein
LNAEQNGPCGDHAIPARIEASQGFMTALSAARDDIPDWASDPAAALDPFISK